MADKLGAAFGLIAVVDARGRQRTRYLVDVLPEGVIDALPNGHWKVERPGPDPRRVPYQEKTWRKPRAPK